MFIKRERYLSELIDRMDNGLIKVVTGLRRCGKTFLLFQIFKDYLLESGVEENQIIAVSLDSMEHKSLRDPQQLWDFIASRIQDSKKQYYVLLDEVQYAITSEEFKSGRPPQIYDVLNGLLKKDNLDVYVTGSNSKLLSRDVLTEFRGRGDEVRVHPFSFSEFMQAYKGDVYQGLSEYTIYGGMPLVLGKKSEEQKSTYLKDLFSETYLRDIEARQEISKTREFEELIDVLASNIGSLTSIGKLEATFKSSKSMALSKNTLARFIDYLEQSFLIEECRRFDIKGRKYIGAPVKYYFEDLGLRNARLNFRQIEPNHIMENVIYNELKIRGYNVDVGIVEKRERTAKGQQRKQLEADFVANYGSGRIYIQSAYKIPDSEKEDQEKASLKQIGDSFKKVLVVHDIIKPHIDANGILTVSVYDFLTKPELLAF